MTTAFKNQIGLNSSKLGSVNAASNAIVLNSKNKVIATCMDTPNNAAYAFSVLKDAVIIKSRFETFKRKDSNMMNRIRTAKSNEAYHKQYLNLK